jgi:ankyrin repeat protein
MVKATFYLNPTDGLLQFMQERIDAPSAAEMEAIETQLRRGAINVHAVDGTNGTLLHWACRMGQLVIAQLLVKYGANPQAVNESLANHTIVHEAATSGDTAMIDWALAVSGLPVDVQMKTGTTPIMLACLTGKANAAAHLKEKGANVDIGRDHAKRTCLHMAAEGGDPVTIRWVKGNSALDIDDASMQGGWTPLMLACKFATKVETVETLLALGADPKKANDKGQTALEFARGNINGWSFTLLALLEKDMRNKADQSAVQLLAAASGQVLHTSP